MFGIKSTKVKMYTSKRMRALKNINWLVGFYLNWVAYSILELVSKQEWLPKSSDPQVIPLEFIRASTLEINSILQVFNVSAPLDKEYWEIKVKQITNLWHGISAYILNFYPAATDSRTPFPSLILHSIAVKCQHIVYHHFKAGAAPSTANLRAHAKHRIQEGSASWFIYYSWFLIGSKHREDGWVTRILRGYSCSRTTLYLAQYLADAYALKRTTKWLL